MLVKLKDILNTYSNYELDNMDLWINGEDDVFYIIVEEENINLITRGAEVKINGYIDKERMNKIDCL